MISDDRGGHYPRQRKRHEDAVQRIDKSAPREGRNFFFVWLLFFCYMLSMEAYVQFYFFLNLARKMLRGLRGLLPKFGLYHLNIHKIFLLPVLIFIFIFLFFLRIAT